MFPDKIIVALHAEFGKATAVTLASKDNDRSSSTPKLYLCSFSESSALSKMYCIPLLSIWRDLDWQYIHLIWITFQLPFSFYQTRALPLHKVGRIMAALTFRACILLPPKKCSVAVKQSWSMFEEGIILYCYLWHLPVTQFVNVSNTLAFIKHYPKIEIYLKIKVFLMLLIFIEVGILTKMILIIIFSSYNWVIHIPSCNI